MPRVLIVDDNEQNLHMLRVLLEGHSYEVLTAHNGVEALELARDEKPDVVVTDILMPEMDGFALCRQWKSDATLKQKPLVFYTATYTGPKDEEFALNLGADQFVVKPSKPAELLKAIEASLERSRKRTNRFPRAPRGNETSLLKQYNETLVRKLEDKVGELEAVNAELKRRLIELAEAHENLRISDRALAATSSGIVITDARRPDNPVISCNDAFLRISGYAREEILGRNCRFLQNSDRNQTAVGLVRQAIREVRGIDVVLRNYRKDGTAFWNHLTISPVRDSSGQLTNFVGIQEDITASVTAEDALRKNEALLKIVTNRIPQALLVVDPQTGSVDFFNDQLLRLWQIEHLENGLKRKELNANHIISSCLGLVEDAPRFLDACKAAVGSRVVDEAVQLIDGRTLRLFCTLIADATGTGSGRLFLFEDITQRRQAEAREEERNAALKRIGILSDREREVLDLLFSGKTNRGIAAELDISDRTVEKHRSNMMRKLRIDNVPELIRLRSQTLPDVTRKAR